MNRIQPDMRWIMLGALVAGCGQAHGDEGAQSSSPASEPADTVTPELRALLTEEAMRLGAAEAARSGEASVAGDACAIACAAGYAALCARIGYLCQTATVVTIGGSTVPCAIAMGAVCVGGAGLAALCGRRCPP